MEKKRTKSIRITENSAWCNSGGVSSELVAKKLNEMQVSD